MIQSDLKPTDKFIKFIEPSDKHGKLKIQINIFADAPVGTTKLQSIHTTIVITEGDEDKKFGMECYEIIFTEKQVREAFKNIAKNPMKFKNQ